MFIKKIIKIPVMDVSFNFVYMGKKPCLDVGE